MIRSINEIRNKIRNYVIARIFFSSSVYNKRRRRLVVGTYVFKNSWYQAWKWRQYPLHPRGKIHGREKEFGWNSAVWLVVDSLVSRDNWPELFNGASLLKFWLHLLLMDVYPCVLRVPVIYSNKVNISA